MKKLTGIVLAAILSLCIAHQAQAALNVAKSAPITAVEATVTGISQSLSVVVKNNSDNQPAAGGKVVFPAGNTVKTSTQYLEVSFQSNTVGSAVILSTDNRGGGASPAFKSGPDGVLGTSDDEAFKPETGVSGAGLVGTSSLGHGFIVPILWAVFDDVQGPAYSFTGDFSKEGVVTDKAQTHAFAGANGALIAQAFDSSKNLAYASVVVGMSQNAQGQNVGQIPSFPQSAGGGLRSVVSPVVVYMGVDYTGAPAQGYATNTLKLEMINQ